MRKQYYNLHFKVMEEDFELFAGAVADFPFKGIEERNDELVICFEEPDYSKNLKYEILEEAKKYIPEISFISEENITERNWNEEWESHVEAIRVNENIAILPQWRVNEFDCPIKIIINPKMSFGTGHHASTRLACRLAEKYVKTRPFWLDVGCGTGVLAILAKKLGAIRVFAFDNNDWAFENAKENLELNGEGDSIELDLLDIDTLALPQADGILANLNRNLILESLAKFSESLKSKKGLLIIAGILVFDREEIETALKSNNFTVLEFIVEEEWISFCAKSN
ncbi:MAG: 50S ribosomal protein L11 methyltransferase [Candidatus Kapabacteria bacterium]|nr:50S ribosomal protein L11 methyltransferase [Candidatus Kapabacteria bacterium]